MYQTPKLLKKPSSEFTGMKQSILNDTKVPVKVKVKVAIIDNNNIIQFDGILQNETCVDGPQHDSGCIYEILKLIGQYQSKKINIPTQQSSDEPDYNFVDNKIVELKVQKKPPPKPQLQQINGNDIILYQVVESKYVYKNTDGSLGTYECWVKEVQVSIETDPELITIYYENHDKNLDIVKLSTNSEGIQNYYFVISQEQTAGKKTSKPKSKKSKKRKNKRATKTRKTKK